MLSYIVRRLLLMIPTLIGISFLVFMLVALAPGGIAAAIMLAQGGGGSGTGGGEAGQRAAQEAYLEERYGLNDPVIVQYLRWLGRVSPIKFGSRDQIDPNGAIIRPPKRLDPPPLAGEWYARGAPIPGPPEPTVVTFEPTDVVLPAGFVEAGRLTLREWIPARGEVVLAGQPLARLETADGDEGILPSPARGILRPIVSPGDRISNPNAPIAELRPDKAGAYRRAEADYARARREFTQARVLLEQALVAYAEGAGLPGAVGEKERPNLGVFREAGPDPALPEHDAVIGAGERALAAYETALDARADLIGVFEARPFRQTGLWLGGVVGIDLPDLGFSFSRSQPSTQLIKTALPVTLTLNFIAVPIIYLIAIPSGILAATRRGTWIDVGSGALFVGLWSIPIVWAGVLAVGYLGSERYLGDFAFPSKGLHALDAEGYTFLPAFGPEGEFRRGYLLDMLWHLCLPVACLVYGGFAVLSKQTRAAMLDNFSADYVRTAKAKGVSGGSIVFRHVFRNSLLPLITMFATVFPLLLSGSVVIEKIFSIQGMGLLLYESIILRDRELLLAIVMIVALINMLALLLADILYALADPRIAYD